MKVAILYSSSQNSLVLQNKGHKVVDAIEVAILYSSSQNSLMGLLNSASTRGLPSRNPLFIKSEFSPWSIGRTRTSVVRSQSFIHQVRILSVIKENSLTSIMWWSRNPLFIKSEFSHDKLALRRAKSVKSQSFIHQVRILSGNSLGRVTWWLPQASQSFIHQVRILSSISSKNNSTSFWCRNPLFIKSEFSRVRFW